MLTFIELLVWSKKYLCNAKNVYNTHQLSIMQADEMKLFRCMLGKTKRDGIRNEDIKKNNNNNECYTLQGNIIKNSCCTLSTHMLTALAGRQTILLNA